MINWKYIKGWNQDEQGENNLYTFIKFQTAGYETESFKNAPILFVSTSNDPTEPDVTSTEYLGHIITESANNQQITTAFSFLNNVAIGGTLTVNGDTTFNNNDKTFNCHQTAFFHNGFAILDNWLTLEGTASVLNFKPTNNAHGKICYNNEEVAYFTSEKDLHINNKCEALYFNATSDRRAKDNLKILNFKALDLINHTNLYSFTYKDTNTPSIGIIAQDVQNVNIDGFKLVDNENATGKDMDYMSVHESKLVYILWQAVKEQQKEIEELKKRLI